MDTIRTAVLIIPLCLMGAGCGDNQPIACTGYTSIPLLPGCQIFFAGCIDEAIYFVGCEEDELGQMSCTCLRDDLSTQSDVSAPPEICTAASDTRLDIINSTCGWSLVLDAGAYQ
jgi:hypothetical protein